MPETPLEDTPAVLTHMHDTSLWEEGDTSALNAREKKRFNKFYAAMRNYFTSEDSIEEIAQKHHISAETLAKLAQQCLLQHEDGKPWGFRALLPGVVVVDHVPEPDATAEPMDEAPAEAISDATAAAEAEVTEVEPVESPSPTQAEPAEPIPGEVQPVEEASDDEMTEDDEDTDKHQAVKVQPTALETGAPEVRAATPAEQETEPSSGEHSEEARPGGENEADPHPASQEQDSPEIEAGVEAEETASRGDAGRQLVPSSKAEVVDATDLTTAVVPFCPEGRYRMPFKRGIPQRRLVRKRWERDERQQRQRKRLRRVFSIALVAAILLTVVTPVGIGLAAYSVYSNVRGLAADGVNRLLHVKSVLNVDKSNPMAALNATKLQQAQDDFNKAESDFIELQQLVNRSDVQNAITQFAPEYGGKLAMAQRLVQVGLDVSRMGSEMSSVAMLGANIIHSSPLASGSNKPLITVSDITAVEGAIVHALYYIDDVQSQMSQVQLKDLPISDRQKAQLTSALALLPTARSAVVQAQDW